jgi:diguanylate cyclase (GGDEF)-like protein
MLDIDNFKSINDNYGHKEGDNVLIKFSDILTKNVRKIDFVIRYGGDEFLIILPNTPPPSVETVIERINYVFKEEFKDLINKLNLGISYGFISFIDYISQIKFENKELNTNFLYENLLNEVDKSLYYFKKLKRVS